MRLAASCEGGGAEEVRGEGEAVAALEAYDEANGGEVNGDVVDATPLAELLAGTRLGADPWPKTCCCGGMNDQERCPAGRKLAERAREDAADAARLLLRAISAPTVEQLAAGSSEKCRR